MRWYRRLYRFLKKVLLLSVLGGVGLGAMVVASQLTVIVGMESETANWIGTGFMGIVGLVYFLVATILDRR